MMVVDLPLPVSHLVSGQVNSGGRGPTQRANEKSRGADFRVLALRATACPRKFRKKKHHLPALHALGGSIIPPTARPADWHCEEDSVAVSHPHVLQQLSPSPRPPTSHNLSRLHLTIVPKTSEPKHAAYPRRCRRCPPRCACEFSGQDHTIKGSSRETKLTTFCLCTHI